MASPVYKFIYDGFIKTTQDLYAYGANGQVEYHGIAKKGAATSDEAWMIEKFTYDASDREIARTTSGENAIWDNRATSVTYS